ncbi:hypothetical protein GE061_009568 [Apolygus lucorum]|uniref:Uncharacterized protein n=1 Tax=Apolygus lucorum TaxID=248454 RepID=A0A8S9Y4P4_APOLU|nr:hypothetical protein GE061_009568 [Apolygus lucorum]
MFMGDPAMSSSGGTAIAVPGELMGYWEAHKRFGVLPWRELFQPAISMCPKWNSHQRSTGKSFAHSGMEGEILQSTSLSCN